MKLRVPGTRVAPKKGAMMMQLLSSQETVQSDETNTVSSVPWSDMSATSKKLRGRWPNREAAFLIFCDTPPQRCASLNILSSRQWRSLLRWLDYSGLALYFLDRMQELRLIRWIPTAVLAQLRHKQAENTERTRAMIRETIAIHTCFQQAHILHAVLKGFSLSPLAAPRPELRSQFDLDFLVAEPDTPEASRILERRGYRLYAASGRTREFKFNEKPGITLKELYKNLASFTVELHSELAHETHGSALRRSNRQQIFGASIPVLSPVDLLLGQGQHAFKHLCGEFTRASHLVEFRRHVLTRYKDNAFWADLRARGEETSGASLALGTVILLITGIMGEFAPDALTSWTVGRLPRSVRLWVELYGRRVVFGSIPGSKLYLLLQSRLEQQDPTASLSVRRKLFPLRLPLPVIRAFPNETLAFKFNRHRMQLQHLLSRLSFHVVEGIRYAWHAYRWRQLLS